MSTRTSGTGVHQLHPAGPAGGSYPKAVEQGIEIDHVLAAARWVVVEADDTVEHVAGRQIEQTVVAARDVDGVGAGATGDGVVAGAGGAIDQIIAEATENDVVAVTPGERVVAAEALQRVGSNIAGERIGGLGAGPVDGGAADQRQVLDICRERVVSELWTIGAPPAASTVVSPTSSTT